MTPQAQCAALAVCVFAATYAGAALLPLQEALAGSMALNDNHIAFLQGPLRFVPLAVLAVPFGLMIDRFNRIHLLTVFIGVGVVANIGTALAADVTTLTLWRLTAGVSTLFLPVVYSLLSDLLKPEQRGRAVMVVGLSQVAGMSAAFAIGGSVFEAIGAWRPSLVLMSAPVIVIALGILVLEEPPRSNADDGRGSTRASFLKLWQLRRVVAPLIAGEMLLQLPIVSIQVWAAPTLSRVFELGAGQAGRIVATALLAGGVIGPILGGYLADFRQKKHGPRSVTSAAAAAAVLCTAPALFPLLPDDRAAIVTLIAFYTGAVVTSVIGMTLFAVTVPATVRGLSFSIAIGASLVFAGVAPVLVSSLSGAIRGPEGIGSALALVCGGSTLLASGVYFSLRRRLATS